MMMKKVYPMAKRAKHVASRHANEQMATAPRPVTLLPLESFQPAFSRSVLAGAVIGGAVAMAPVSASYAQDGGASQTLGTVTVTGAREEGYQAPVEASSPRFTAPLLDTPKSVTVIPEELIRDRGATSLQDVLRTTPGITLGAGEGGTPNGDRPFVRGYEASTDMFIDGVRDYGRTSHETFNLESVEVIKGPSSAYTGRGGTGGSINLQTKSPRLSNFVEASAGIGNAGQWRATADGNVMFSDSGAFRLNLMKMGGEVPGRNGVTVDRWGFAPSVAFGLGTPTRVKLQYSRVENNDMPDQGIPFSNAAHPEQNRPPKVDRDNFYGRLNADFRENVMKTATATVEHDFSSDLKLRNILRQSKTLNHYLLTRPSFDNCALMIGNPSAPNPAVGTPACDPLSPNAQFTRGNRTWWRQSESLVNQTDLYGNFRTGEVKHTYSVGLELGREKIYNRSMAGAPANEIDSLHHPDPYRNYAFNLTYGPRTAGGEIKTQSLYFFDTMEINDRFSVNAGLRRERFELDNLATNPANRFQRTDSFWNYQLGLVYKPAENGSVYLSYGTSSEPSGSNLGQGGGADGAAGAATLRQLEPEKSRSWELGTKWDVLDHRLSLTAAVFETRKTDARSTDPLTGIVTLSGNNRTRGFELGATGAITPQWSIWAGYTYLDPKIVTYRSGTSVFDGKRIKFVAKQSATLWTTYKLTPALSIGGGASYTGMRYADDANSLELPSWVRYDAMARYEVNQRLSVQFNVNNIADKPLYDASHVGLFATVAPGRSYLLSATYRFD